MRSSIFAAIVFAALFCALPVAAKIYIPPGVQADYILVEKAKHELTLFRQGKILKTYIVALGRGGLGKKVMEGDKKVPEGVYFIEGRNHHSQYFLSLKISYPSQGDIERARLRRVSPGGSIMIHGLRNDLAGLGPSHRKEDWTAGCIAVTDEEILEIWDAVADGTPIEIKP